MQERLFPRRPLIAAVETDSQDVVGAVTFWSLTPSGPVQTMVVHIGGGRLQEGEAVALGQAVWAGLS